MWDPFNLEIILHTIVLFSSDSAADIRNRCYCPLLNKMVCGCIADDNTKGHTYECEMDFKS